MSPTIPMQAGLRIRYYGRTLSRCFRLQPLPSFHYLGTNRQSRTLYSWHRNASNPPRLQKWNGALSQGIFAAVLFTGVATSYTIVNSKPIKLDTPESSDDYLGLEDVVQQYRPPIPPMTMEQASEMLRWEESYQIVGKGSGVLRFDTVRIPSNSPTEDEQLSASGHEDNDIRWLVWAVFDGHAGGETALALHDFMLKYLVRGLADVSPNRAVSDVPPQAIDQAIATAFLSLDNDILDRAAKALSKPVELSEAISDLGPAFAGSCALISYYNSDSQQLKVACTGDSRAVLGRRNAAGKWEATALSVDQNGWNEDEVARLQAEHPNEPGMIKDGRVLNIAVSRAFGDARFKWPRKWTEDATKRFFGPSIQEPYLTPPYLTAEPVITTTKIEPEKGDFLIMASDGLWDKVTNEQAIDLVGRWLKTHDPSQEVTHPNLAQAPTTLVTPRQPSTGGPGEWRTYRYSQSVNSKDFIVADENAATHLARNALGGANEDMLCGMLTAGPSMSRNLRDDITIQVIFFGNEDSTIRNH